MDQLPDAGFKKSLNFFDVTGIGIGTIIGAGIYIVIGIVAERAGPALIISILIAGLISILTALSFAELTAWLPAEGGIYDYSRKLISKPVGFLAGWMWVISNIFGGAAVALAFGHYLNSVAPGLSPKLIAVLLAFGMTMLNYFGIRHSLSFNNILVIAELIILLFFSIIGLFHLNPMNFRPLFGPFTNIFVGANFIFFAFIGFGRAAIVAEEVKNARRIVPEAIIAALGISVLIYILVGISALGLASAKTLSMSYSPLATAIKTIGNPSLVYVISAGALIATASVTLSSILGVSRMLFAIAREHELPVILSKLHGRYNVPYAAILLSGVIIIILTLFVNLTRVVSVSIFASLFCYSLANLSAIRLKRQQLHYPLIIPILGLITCLGLLFFIQKWSIVVGMICIAAGIIYCLIRKKILRQ
jgi:APA family basic amino acid/polyamine antiporter